MFGCCFQANFSYKYIVKEHIINIIVYSKIVDVKGFLMWMYVFMIKAQYLFCFTLPTLYYYCFLFSYTNFKQYMGKIKYKKRKAKKNHNWWWRNFFFSFCNITRGCFCQKWCLVDNYNIATIGFSKCLETRWKHMFWKTVWDSRF